MKTITPEETLFLQVDPIRKNGPIDIAQGFMTVLALDIQLNEYFVECTKDSIMSPCLQKYFDNEFGTTDVNNITAKYSAIEGIKIMGTEYLYDKV